MDAGTFGEMKWDGQNGKTAVERARVAAVAREGTARAERDGRMRRQWSQAFGKGERELLRATDAH